MTEHFAYLFLGLGNGAVYAALGLALVMTFKSSGVVNFATGAVALYTTYTYGLLREGELLIPVPGFPSTIELGGELDLVPAVAISLVIAAALGALLYLVVFRPMRSASWPKTQMPTIIPTTVTAVHIEDLVRLKPSCLDRKLGIQIMMP